MVTKTKRRTRRRQKHYGGGADWSIPRGYRENPESEWCKRTGRSPITPFYGFSRHSTLRWGRREKRIGVSACRSIGVGKTKRESRGMGLFAFARVSSPFREKKTESTPRHTLSMNRNFRNVKATSPEPNGFPSPPPVSFPKQDERFALRGPREAEREKAPLSAAFRRSAPLGWEGGWRCGSNALPERVVRLCPDMPAYARIFVGGDGRPSSKLASIRLRQKRYGGQAREAPNPKFQNFATASYRLFAKPGETNMQGRIVHPQSASVRFTSLGGGVPLFTSGATGKLFLRLWDQLVAI
jgi:hypothetical protein